MKRLILAALLLPSLAFAQQEQTPVIWGYPAYASTAVNSNNLNAATTRDAFGFNVSTNLTLTSFDLYCQSETNSVDPTDIHAELFSASSTGGPGTSIEDVTADFSTGCPGVKSFVFNSAVTAGIQYYVVLRNANAAPATNFITYRRVSQGSMFPALGGGSGAGSSWGFGFRQSTDSGTTWATGNGSGSWGGVRFGFGSGGSATYAGIPLTDMLEDTNEAYDARCTGVYFEVPTDAPGLRVAASAMIPNWNGTKPLQLEQRIYTGSTPSLLATSRPMEDEAVEASNWTPQNYTSVQTLAAGTVVRLVYCPVFASGATDGSAGNAFTLNRFTGRNDAESRTLFPYNMKGTYFNGTTWAEDDTKIVPFALILDTADPYDVSAGGLKNLNQVSGGTQ